MNLSLRFIVATFIFISIFIVASLTKTDVHAYVSGAPGGVSGSPSDRYNCTACHSGTATTATGLITSNIPTQGYTPGQTYTITASLTQAGLVRFGFEISPQSASGVLLGTLIRTDLTRTQIVSTKYITHTSSGTSGSGTITWSFNWKAPAKGTGNVTFYGAFNFANNDGGTSGDHIKLSQLATSENTIASVEMIAEKNPIKIWPNPVQSLAHIEIPNAANQYTVQLLNSTGKLMLQEEKSSFDFNLDLSGYASGIYFLSVTTAEGNYTQRLIKI